MRPKPKVNFKIPVSRTNNPAQIYLIKAELYHCKALLSIENSPLVWLYSRGGDAPYTMEQIKQFIARADTLHKDGQQRFLVSRNTAGAGVGVDNQDIIGTADLYNYNPANNSAYVAILIYPFNLHRQGLGRTALKLLIDYAFGELGLGALYAQIEPRNSRSIAFFTSLGFQLLPNSTDTYILK